MSNEELPPTQDLPIFDNSVFQRGTEGLTYDEARKSFLAFPTAQGNETLLDATVLGTLTTTNIIFPSGQSQTNSAFATFNETTTSSTVSYTNTKYLNSTINFISNQNTTITIPTPVIGSYLRIFNNCEYSATLNIDGTKTFTGEWGNSDPTIRLNQNSWSLLYATATTGWNIIDRSANQFFDPITVSVNTSYAPHYNLLNCYVPFNPTVSNPTITIPQATSTFSRNKTFYIENTSLENTLTLSITSPDVFTGAYGSESQTLIVPFNSWTRLYSNGTNWVCNDISVYGWTLQPTAVNNNVIQFLSQYIRNYISSGLDNGWGCILTNILSSANAYKEGLEINLRKVSGRVADTYAFYLTVSTSNTSTNTLYIYANGNGSQPLTGSCSISYSQTNNPVLKCIKAGVAGSGTATISIGNPLLTINTQSSGILVYGTVITLGGVNYTIRGMKSVQLNTPVNAVISATSGTGVSTLFNIGVGNSGFPTVGNIFVVAGVNYTITGITGGNTLNGSGTFPNGNLTVNFTPVAPTTWSSVNWTLLPTGLGTGTGVTYVVSPVPSVALSSTAYTNNSVYSWTLKN